MSAPKTLVDVTRLEPKTHDEIIEAEHAVHEYFGYRAWQEPQIEAGNVVREALENAYVAILLKVPSSPTRTRALNCLIDARMLANMGITFNGMA